jgi:hypothetical protein
MNRLITVLRSEPAVVTEAADAGGVGFRWLLDALGERMLNRRELLAVANTPGALDALNAGYLPAITAWEWEDLLQASDEEPAHVSPWWTVMIPGDGGLGLTAPEDASDDDLISLLVGPSDASQPISWNLQTLALAGNLPNLDVISRVQHCPPATRYGCGPGICGGCRGRRVYSKRTGYGGRVPLRRSGVSSVRRAIDH